MRGTKNRPISVIEDHLEGLRTCLPSQHHVITEANPPDRLELSFAIVQHGRYLEFLGQDNQKLFPIERILDDVDANANGKGKDLPPLFVIHGKDDSVVPCQGTTLFVETLARTRPLARYRLELQPGEHGFDADASIHTTDWLKGGLDFISSFWPKKDIHHVL